MDVAVPFDDNSRGPELVAITWIFTAIAIVVVGLKLFTRARILRELALDDVFTVISLTLVIICTSIISASVGEGMGRHAVFLSPHQRVRATKLNYISNPFGIMAYSLPNISVAIFLNRILSLPRLQKWALFSVAIAQSIITGIACVLLFAQCNPSRFLWDPTIPATCLSPDVITGYSYFVGAYSAFTDVLLAVIPAFAFWKLQLRTQKKLGLCLLMSTTLFAAICAIVKTSKLNELANLADFTYATVDLLIWVVVEANVIIIAACIPSLRPFAISMTQTLKEHSRGSRQPRSTDVMEYGSKTPLALGQMQPGTSTVECTTRGDDRSSQNSSRPSQGVKQTTDVVLEWDDV